MYIIPPKMPKVKWKSGNQPRIRRRSKRQPPDVPTQTRRLDKTNHRRPDSCILQVVRAYNCKIVVDTIRARQWMENSSSDS